MIAENGNGILWTWSKGFFQTFTTDQVLAGMLGGRQSSQRHFTLVSSIIHWFSTKVELVADVNNVYQHSAKLAMINCTIKHFQSHFALSWVLNVVPFRTFIFRFIEPCCGRTESSSSNFFRLENACYTAVGNIQVTRVSRISDHFDKETHGLSYDLFDSHWESVVPLISGSSAENRICESEI